jgi:ribosomal protein S19
MDDLIDTKISIYNGKSFINVFIDNLKIGYKFGQFSHTRKKFEYKKVKKTKKKK